MTVPGAYASTRAQVTLSQCSVQAGVARKPRAREYRDMGYGCPEQDKCMRSTLSGGSGQLLGVKAKGKHPKPTAIQGSAHVCSAQGLELAELFAGAGGKGLCSRIQLSMCSARPPQPSSQVAPLLPDPSRQCPVLPA